VHLHFRHLIALGLLAVPSVAFAQPADPSGEPNGSASPAGPDPNTPEANGDERRIRELVDRELARVLTERAAKEAAERAASENDQPSGTTGVKLGDVKGQSGLFDTRIAFTMTNENVLVQPGETIPSVPGWRFGIPNSLGVLFFDNYDTRYSGFETLSHVTAYRDVNVGHIEAEAAFVMRINELSGTNIALSDDGSYIVLTDWKDPTHKDPTRISLTAFPVSADRFRLGYSYRLSWGGDPEYSRSTSATPGVKLQYDTNGAYAFVGAKSAVILDQATAEQKSALAGLFGAGIDPNDMVRLEFNGGYFDRGFNELIDVDNQHVQLFGGSVQASIHHGMPIRSSVDYRLYKYNGEQISGLFQPETYPGGLSWLAQSEFTVLGQTLKDAEKTGATKIQYGKAGDVNIRVKDDRVRLRADISYRDLGFILHSVPSLPTYEDFPAEYTTSADLFAAVGADKNWNDWLTLGVIAGIEKPATLTSPTGIPGSSTTGDSTAVIRNNNIDTIITILPPGAKVEPQVALKGTMKIDFARLYSALIEVFYSHDPNATEYVRQGCAVGATCPDAPFEYQFANQNQLGVNVTLQARF
jgi:hypothetical protein